MLIFYVCTKVYMLCTILWKYNKIFFTGNIFKYKCHLDCPLRECVKILSWQCTTKCLFIHMLVCYHVIKTK